MPDKTVGVILGGGVINNAPALLKKLIREKVTQRYPKARVVSAKLPPSVGAALMASYNDGQNARQLFSKVRKDYLKSE